MVPPRVLAVWANTLRGQLRYILFIYTRTRTISLAYAVLIGFFISLLFVVNIESKVSRIQVSTGNLLWKIHANACMNNKDFFRQFKNMHTREITFDKERMINVFINTVLP